MNQTLKKVAIVTGGNRGIGREVCIQLATAGCAVVVGCRSNIEGDWVVKEIKENNGNAEYLPLDVSDIGNIEETVRRVVSKHGRIDILVNNAGIFLDGPSGDEKRNYPKFTELDLNHLKNMIEVNLYGPVRLMQEVLPHMISQKYGRIVNVSTGWSRKAELDEKAPFYRISKAALNIATKTTALEMRHHNILINAVCPGWVRTRMGGRDAIRSAAEGARGIVLAALLPDSGPTGVFMRDGEEIGW